MDQQSWSRPLRVNWLTVNGNRRRTYKTTTERVPIKQNGPVKQNGLRGGFTRRLKPPPPLPQQVKSTHNSFGYFGIRSDRKIKE